MVARAGAGGVGSVAGGRSAVTSPANREEQGGDCTLEVGRGQAGRPAARGLSRRVRRGVARDVEQLVRVVPRRSARRLAAAGDRGVITNKDESVDRREAPAPDPDPAEPY